jgi:hypothetical protein
VAWADIHPRLPWLVDALLCMAMDFVIMGQFVAYRQLARRQQQGKAGGGAQHGGGGRGRGRGRGGAGRSGAAGGLQEPLLGAEAV